MNSYNKSGLGVYNTTENAKQIRHIRHTTVSTLRRCLKRSLLQCHHGGIGNSKHILAVLQPGYILGFLPGHLHEKPMVPGHHCQKDLCTSHWTLIEERESES